MIDWKPASEPPTKTKYVLGWFYYNKHEGFARFVWWLDRGNGDGRWAPPGVTHWADVDPPSPAR